jgi:hypothetical protein
MPARDWLAFALFSPLPVLTGCGARSLFADLPDDAGAPPQSPSVLDAGEVALPDAASESVDAAVDAADEAATVYCGAACAEDPPICEEGYRGNRCFDVCWMVYVTQASENDPANLCPQGPYYLVECLAANPGACERANPACQEEWQLQSYCLEGW